MPRFIQDADYAMQIRGEIRRLLEGSAPGDPEPSPRLLRAEDTAIAQVRGYLTGRYDCDIIFNIADRNQFLVTTVIDLALYHLYSQTGSKDVPEHRKHRYQDAIEWLRDAGRGNITADLPSSITDLNPGGSARIWGREPNNHKW